MAIATVTRPTGDGATLPSSSNRNIIYEHWEYVTNILAFLEGANLKSGNVDSSSTDAILVADVAQVSTALHTWEDTTAAAGGVQTVAKFGIDPASGTPAANDGGRLVMYADDAGGAESDIAYIDWVMTTATAGAEVGRLDFYVAAGAGSCVSQVQILDGSFIPTTDSDVSLGITGTRWSDLFVDAATVGGALTLGGAVALTNTLTVGVDDTGHDVIFYGASAGAFAQWDESEDTWIVQGATAAGPGVMRLATGELTIVDNDILGRLEFIAPLESSGTDAILVAASIWAEAEATFDASTNTTALVFATGTSETAAEQMRLGGDGNLHIGDGNGVVIGHPSQITAGGAAELQVMGTSQTTDASILIGLFDATDNQGPILGFLKSGNDTVGSNTIVADNEVLANINFYAADGNDFATIPVQLRAFVDDASPADSAIGGEFVIRTATTAGSLTEAMRIDSSQNVTIGTGTYAATKTALNIGGGTTADTLTFHLNDTTSTLGQSIGNIDWWGNDAGAGDQIRARISTEYGGSAGTGDMRFETYESTTDSLVTQLLIDTGASAANFVFGTTATLLTGGETANANMSAGGLTLNQNAADDEIFSLKSSDIAHGMTTRTETDTYFMIKKWSGTTGAAWINGYGETGEGFGIVLMGTAGDVNTTKSTTAEAPLHIRSAIKNGTGDQAPTADGNLVTISADGTVRFIFDTEGSGHADVEWTTYSDARLKSNIRDLPYGIETVKALQPRIFDRQSGFLNDGVPVLEDKKRVQIGLIAQEAEPHIPELLNIPEDPSESFYSMDYERLSVVNLMALKELIARVEKLEMN